jgi:hypothetical protein
LQLAGQLATKLSSGWNLEMVEHPVNFGHHIADFGLQSYHGPGYFFHFPTHLEEIFSAGLHTNEGGKFLPLEGSCITGTNRYMIGP